MRPLLAGGCFAGRSEVVRQQEECAAAARQQLFAAGCVFSFARSRSLTVFQPCGVGFSAGFSMGFSA
jgi:hypothetical protein